MREAREANAPRHEHRPHDEQLHRERQRHRARVEPVRQMLHVPSRPRGQRPVLIVFIHGGEVAPVHVTAHELHQSGFEVDPEPLPPQHEEADTRRRIVRAQSRTKSTRREPDGDEPRLEQHPVGLVGREILQRRDERKEEQGADRASSRVARRSPRETASTRFPAQLQPSARYLPSAPRRCSAHTSIGSRRATPR